MRKIREVLRLKFEVGLSARQVAISLQVGRASVGEYLNRFAASGLTWPSALTDAELQRHLFPPPPPAEHGTGGRMLVGWVAGWRGMRSSVVFDSMDLLDGFVAVYLTFLETISTRLVPGQLAAKPG